MSEPASDFLEGRSFICKIIIFIDSRADDKTGEFLVRFYEYYMWKKYFFAGKPFLGRRSLDRMKNSYKRKKYSNTDTTYSVHK